MKAYFMTIFWIKLSYQLDETCLPEDLNIEHEEQPSPVSPKTGLLKNIFE